MIRSDMWFGDAKHLEVLTDAKYVANKRIVDRQYNDLIMLLLPAASVKFATVCQKL